ncbi:hypothetical protein TGVEG_440150 [Toxoplasma gondii VEG]|uniref:Uncharacterized protein n=1 Tax=Toxoplasma gondii (strain ATCC 50861 / VEG) TaxID=432359 RepID=V4ZLN1_TOXGV|nr:hypothetical protein TGVEG_440150 [Toxoplasma gondii VEG]
MWMGPYWTCMDSIIVEPGPQEEDSVGKESEELPEANSQGAERPTQPSADAEGQHTGTPDLDGSSEGETHPDTQSPGHGSASPQAESVPNGQISGIPTSTPDNQEYQLPEVQENGGGDGEVGDSADPQDSAGQGNHDAHEDEDPQKKTSGQGVNRVQWDCQIHTTKEPLLVLNRLSQSSLLFR